jgi:hypothetical protein
MGSRRPKRPPGWLRRALDQGGHVLALAAAVVATVAAVASVEAGSAFAAAPVAEALRAEFAALPARAANGEQGSVRLGDRPLFLRSNDVDGRLQGEVHALVDQPYATVRRTLARPASWCEILFLHLNVKYCRPAPQDPSELRAAMGRKIDQPLDAVFWLRAKHEVRSDGDELLQVSLEAAEGPMGTKDFRLALEALPYGEGRTLLHLNFQYGYGFVARLATQGYLDTLGRDKVGFTITGRDAEGRPVAIGGLRGLLERNTMRYYLAIEAHLAAAALPAEQRVERSLRAWFDATERYARQLHEIERDEYLAMKRREWQRQQSEPPPAVLAPRPGG